MWHRGLSFIVYRPSSKQRPPQKVGRQCGQQWQDDSPQTHARKEHRPQRDGHPGQRSNRNNGREEASHKHVGRRQPQRCNEGRSQAQRKRVRADRTKQRGDNVVIQRLVAVTRREVDGEVTAQDIFGRLPDDHLVMMQAGWHIVQLPDAEEERDQQQADHRRPFPPQMLAVCLLHLATRLAPCRSPAALLRPLSQATAGDSTNRQTT